MTMDESEVSINDLGTSGAVTHLVGRKVILRCARVEDAEFILNMRSDPERSRFLLPTDPSIENQRRFLIDYCSRERSGDELYYVVGLLDGLPIGTVRVKELRSTHVTITGLLSAKPVPRFVIRETGLLLYGHLFNTLGVTRLFFDVDCQNRSVVAFHKRCGATIEEVSCGRVYFVLTHDDYRSADPFREPMARAVIDN